MIMPFPRCIVPGGGDGERKRTWSTQTLGFRLSKRAPGNGETTG